MRAVATRVERMEMNNLRDALLNKVKLELKSVDQSCLPLNLNRQEKRDVVDNELKSYRRQLGVGRGRPKRAITLYRELKKNQALLDAEFI